MIGDMVYLIILVKKLYQIMMTFEITATLADLMVKLTMTAGVFLINTRAPMMTQHDIGGRAADCVVTCQCNQVQLILFADYCTFQKYNIQSERTFNGNAILSGHSRSGL